MKCRHCGKENPEGYKFCGYCGKEQRSCPKCGQDVPSDMLYCGHCGVKMEQSSNPEFRPAVHSPYKGKTCPYCQAPFKDEADVVLCKDCGMPHHRGCWAENGNKCTTFGCAGATARKAQQSNNTKYTSQTARKPIAVNVTESAVESASGLQVGESEEQGKVQSFAKIGAVIGAGAGAVVLGAVGGGSALLLGAFMGAFMGGALGAMMGVD